MLGLLRKLVRRNRPVGRVGEDVASEWLRKRGYTILQRNLSIGDDEADLIALDPDRTTIVIVEVKTRHDVQAIPEQSITPTKQFRLNRFASALQKRAAYRDRPLRFDAIAIVLPHQGEPIVRHIPGAFQSKW
jgi:putative endonuclease